VGFLNSEITEGAEKKRKRERAFSQIRRHSKSEKVLQELLAGFGEDGFGVELDAFDFVAAVAEAHDDAVVGFRGDGELAGQGFSFDNERMIAGRG